MMYVVVGVVCFVAGLALGWATPEDAALDAYIEENRRKRKLKKLQNRC